MCLGQHERDSAEDERIQVLEAARMGYWRWDMASNRMEWPEHVESLFGLTPGSLANTFDACLALIPLPGREQLLAAIATAQQQHAPHYEVEHRIVWKDLARRDLAQMEDSLNEIVKASDGRQNLIENALTYTRPGVPPVIEIGAKRADTEIRLYVRDNGAGIPAAYLERIFGLFQRLNTRTEGTGVGLAIARGIVDMYGGRIWVESEVGKGSIFWIAPPSSVIVDSDPVTEGRRDHREQPSRD